LHLLPLVVLAVLPGAWVAYGFRSTGLNESTRFAMSVAFSPFVVSVEFLLLKLLGVPIAVSAPVILLAALPSGALMFMRRRESRPPTELRDLPWKLLAVAVPILALLLQWNATPGLRAFGWHNLLHTDIVYALLRPRCSLRSRSSLPCRCRIPGSDTAIGPSLAICRICLPPDSSRSRTCC
jgi:hypothetical protein